MGEDEKTKWMVCVHCATYNHAPYIEDSMNGFCMQITTFPYVCVIVDDASTDKEHEVISNYMKEHFEHTDITKEIEETDDFVMTFAQHKVNKNCYFAFHRLKYNHGSIKKPRGPYYTKWDNEAKYISFCEGDDYWINPTKLQKQVGFMESHPEYSLCFSDVLYFNTDIQKSKGKISIISKKANLALETLCGEQLFMKILVGGCYIQTLSVMYRTKDYINIPPNDTSFAMGDTPLWLDLSQQGKVKYIDEVMGVYNIHRGSSTHTDSKKRLRFDLSIEEMKAYYCRKYNYEIPVIVKRRYNKAYIRLLSSEIDFSALYEPFGENKLQIWQIRQLKKKTWYFIVYNKLILPIQKIMDYISIKANIVWSIIWNRI